MSSNPSEEKPWVEMSRYSEKQEQYSASMRRPEHFGVYGDETNTSINSAPNRVDRVTTSSGRGLYSTSGQRIPLQKTSSVLTSSYVAALPPKVQAYLQDTAQFSPPQAISVEPGTLLPPDPYKKKAHPPLFQHVKSSSSRVPTFKTSANYFDFKDRLGSLPPQNTDGAIERSVTTGAVPVRADLITVQNGNTGNRSGRTTTSADFIDRTYSANGLDVKFSAVLGSHKKVLSILDIFSELEAQLDQNFSLLDGDSTCTVHDLVDWCRQQRTGSLSWMVPWLEEPDQVENQGLPPPELISQQQSLMLCIGKSIVAVGQAYDLENVRLSREERNVQLQAIQGILETVGKMVVTTVEGVFRKHQLVVRQLQNTITELKHNTNLNSKDYHHTLMRNILPNTPANTTNTTKQHNSNGVDVDALLAKNIDVDDLPVSSILDVEKFHKQHNNSQKRIELYNSVPYKENTNIIASNLQQPQSSPRVGAMLNDTSTSYATALHHSASKNSTLEIGLVDKSLAHVDHPMLPTLISTHRNLLKSQKYELLKKISTLEEENTMLREVIANRSNDVVIETALYEMGTGVMSNLRSLTELLGSITTSDSQRAGLLSELSSLIRSTTVAHDYTKNLESLAAEEVRARTVLEVGRQVEAERRDFRQLKFASSGYDSSDEFGTNLGFGRAWLCWKTEGLPVELVELKEDDGAQDEVAPRGVTVEVETQYLPEGDTAATAIVAPKPAPASKRDKVLAEVLFEDVNNNNGNLTVNVNGLHWFLEHLLSRMNACKGEDAVAVMSQTQRRTLRLQEKTKSTTAQKEVKKNVVKRPMPELRVHTAPSRRSSVTYIKMQRGKMLFSQNEELPHHLRRLATSPVLRSLLGTYHCDLAPHAFARDTKVIARTVGSSGGPSVDCIALLQFLQNVFILHAAKCMSLPADALPQAFLTTLYCKVFETVTSSSNTFSVVSLSGDLVLPSNPLFKLHSSKRHLEPYNLDDSAETAHGNTHLHLLNVAAKHKPKARRDLELDALLRKNLIATERAVAGICRDILSVLEFPAQPTPVRCQVLAFQELLGQYVEEHPGEVASNIIASLAGHLVVEAQTVGRFSSRTEEADASAEDTAARGDEQRVAEAKTLLASLHLRCIDPLAAPLIALSSTTTQSTAQLQGSQTELVPNLHNIASARTLLNDTEKVPKRSLLTDQLDETPEQKQVESVLSRLPCHVAVKAQYSWVQAHGLPTWVWIDAVNSLVTYALRGFGATHTSIAVSQSTVLMLVDTAIQLVRRNTHLAVLLPILNEAALKTPALRNHPLSSDVQNMPVGSPMDAIIRNILSKQYQGTGTVVKERLLRLLGSLVQLHHCLEHHNSKNLEQRENYSKVGVDMSLVVQCASAAIRKWVCAYNKVIIQKFNALSKFSSDPEVINKEQFAQLLSSCDRKFSLDQFHHLVQQACKLNGSSAIFTQNRTFFPVELNDPPVLSAPVQSGSMKNTTVLEPEADTFTLYSVLATCTSYRIGCDCAYGLGRSDVHNRNNPSYSATSKLQQLGNTITMVQQLGKNILQGYETTQTRNEQHILPLPITFLCMLRLQANDIAAEANCMQTLQYYRERLHLKNDKAKRRAALAAASEEIPLDTLIVTTSNNTSATIPIISDDPEKSISLLAPKKNKISNPFTASKDAKDINLE